MKSKPWKVLLAMALSIAAFAITPAMASAGSRNCGFVANGDYCTGMLSDYATFSLAGWGSDSGVSGCMPLRVLYAGGGGASPWVCKAPNTWHPFGTTSGWVQVKNISGRTINLGVSWL